MWGNEKLKKRCFTENFDSCIADKIVGSHLSDFTKKTRQVNKKYEIKVGGGTGQNGHCVIVDTSIVRIHSRGL